MNSSQAPSVYPDKKLGAIIWLACTLEGLAALIFLLRTPSEAGSSFFLGYSFSRVIVSFAILTGIIVFGLVWLHTVRRTATWKKAASRIHQIFSNSNTKFWGLMALLAIFLVGVGFFILASSNASDEWVILSTLLDRAGAVLVWVLFITVQVGFLVWRIPSSGPLLTPFRKAIVLSLVTILYFLTAKIWMTAAWDIRLRGMENTLFLPAIIALTWGVLHQRFHQKPWYPRLNQILLLVFLGVCIYVVYWQTALWMGWRHTPSKSYWHLLAESLLKGQLYLDNPPTTHDLTFFNGRWYVPNPPLPVFFFLPAVALMEVEQINTIQFSIFWAAVNVVLVFLILQEASRQKIIPTSRTSNLWITILLAFGTTHWWLGIMGRMWFISQILTLTFAAAAVLLGLRKASPWLVGLCLGLALLSRPNIFTLWPFLVGIALYHAIQASPQRFPWKQIISWSIQSAVPVVLAVAGLLSYNYIRFGNFLDFGYVTITSAEWLTSAVQTYGMFNPHFFPANFQMMFLKFPQIQLEGACVRFAPGREGYSILAMTPAILYLFRRLKLNWLTGLAWGSVILSAGLLLLYHNTGAWQLGYRYLMDFILPVLLLIGIGVGERPSWLFKGLVILSILGNLLGIIWWFNWWWC